MGSVKLFLFNLVIASNTLIDGFPPPLFSATTSKGSDEHAAIAVGVPDSDARARRAEEPHFRSVIRTKDPAS